MSTLTFATMKCLNKNLSTEVIRHLNFVWSKNLSSTAALKNIQVQVTPKDALLDNPPVIRVEGLGKNENVTLWNTYTDDSGILFSSHAHYIADGQGVVDVQNHMSHGGKYKGIFPEGLVSTLHSAPPVVEATPKLKWARLYKKNVETPMKYTLNVLKGHVGEDVIFSKSGSPKSMGETEFFRKLMADGVTRSELETDKFKGVLFKPPGEGPFPVLLDLFGAESGIKEFRSAMLASYGYASLVLPYYQYKDLPPLKDRLDLEYFLNAIDYIDSMPGAAGGGIGVVGSSKGGEIALAVATLTDKIKACVTINCYHMSVDVNLFHENKQYVEGCVPGGDTVVHSFTKEGHMIGHGTDKMYVWDIKDILPVEKIPEDCQVLIATSDEDSGLAYRSGVAMRERARRFKRNNISVAVYAGAGHLLDPPFHSHMIAIWNSVIQVRKPDGTKFTGLPHLYGGSPQAMCEASKDLWRRTLALYHKKLVQEKGLPLDTAKWRTPY